MSSYDAIHSVVQITDRTYGVGAVQMGSLTGVAMWDPPTIDFPVTFTDVPDVEVVFHVDNKQTFSTTLSPTGVSTSTFTFKPRINVQRQPSAFITNPMAIRPLREVNYMNTTGLYNSYGISLANYVAIETWSYICPNSAIDYGALRVVNTGSSFNTSSGTNDLLYGGNEPVYGAVPVWANNRFSETYERSTPPALNFRPHSNAYKYKYSGMIYETHPLWPDSNVAIASSPTATNGYYDAVNPPTWGISTVFVDNLSGTNRLWCNATNSPEPTTVSLSVTCTGFTAMTTVLPRVKLISTTPYGISAIAGDAVNGGVGYVFFYSPGFLIPAVPPYYLYRYVYFNQTVTTIDIAEVDGNPAIACGPTLMYSRSPTNRGNQLPWPLPVVFNGVTASTVRLGWVGRRVVIVYTTSGGDLYAVKSEDEHGDTWGTPVLLRSGIQPNYIDMTVIKDTAMVLVSNNSTLYSPAGDYPVYLINLQVGTVQWIAKRQFT